MRIKIEFDTPKEQEKVLTDLGLTQEQLEARLVGRVASMRTRQSEARPGKDRKESSLNRVLEFRKRLSEIELEQKQRRAAIKPPDEVA